MSYLDGLFQGGLGGPNVAGGQGLQMPGQAIAAQGALAPGAVSTGGLAQGFMAQAPQVDPWGLMAMIDQSKNFGGTGGETPPLDWAKMAGMMKGVAPFDPSKGLPPVPQAQAGRPGGPGGAQAPVPTYLQQQQVKPVPLIGTLLAGRK